MRNPGRCALALALLLSGCGLLDPGSPGGTDGGPVDLICDADAGRVTLADLHPQVMGAICSQCHQPGVTVPDLSTVEAVQANAVGQTSLRYGSNGLKIVDPGKLANSVLWLKVNGGSPRIKGPHGEGIGGQMPAGQAALGADKKALIKQWICAGAP